MFQAKIGNRNSNSDEKFNYEIPHGYLSAVSISKDELSSLVPDCTLEDFKIFITAVYHHHDREDKWESAEIKQYCNKYYLDNLKDYYKNENKKIMSANVNKLLFRNNKTSVNLRIKNEIWEKYALIKGLLNKFDYTVSSGYEEAAAQGIIAGINAAMYVKNEEPLILDRSEAYIGVLIDDLVTKESTEPYRMMTSRAEYRLILRQDNADLRLSKYGHRVGLINDERMAKVELKEKQIAEEVERVKSVNIGTGKEVLDLLEKYGSTELKTGVTLAELVKRPELNYEILAPIDKHRPELAWDVAEQVNINLKYEGYIERQLRQVEHFKKLESKIIPDDIDYNEITGLRKEAIQKLNKMKPRSIGQASRISGVSPADISVLLVYMEQFRRKKM